MTTTKRPPVAHRRGNGALSGIYSFGNYWRVNRGRIFIAWVRDYAEAERLLLAWLAARGGAVIDHPHHLSRGA